MNIPSAPESQGHGLADVVQLDRDHPGFRDPAYRARRNAIASLALAYAEGDPVPQVEYTADEHGVWRAVWKELAPLHECHACAAYRRAAELLPLDHERIPQLSYVDAQVAAHGLRMLPVPGLVTPRRFLEYLGRGIFLATQYVRHQSTPLYTPEPDVIHEFVGHAVGLVHPLFAELNLGFGRAAIQADEQRIERLIRLYWYTLEFGVVEEGGDLRVYGAGLLSSYGELSSFRTRPKLKELDLDEASATPFDPTDYQKVLFVAKGGLEKLRTDLDLFLSS